MREGAVHFIIMPATLQTRAATTNMFVSATNSCARRSWPGLLVTPDGRIASRLPQDEPGILMSLIDADRGYYDASALSLELGEKDGLATIYRTDVVQQPEVSDHTSGGISVT